MFRFKKSFPGRAFRYCAALVFGLAALNAVGALPAFAQTPPPPPPPDEADVPPTEKTEKPSDGTTPTPTSAPSPSAPPAQGGGRYLLLPDISLNGIFLGHLSNDKRDQTRDRFRLDQAELAVQSYVYPEIKLDTFIVFNGSGGVNVEEAYLTYQRLPIGDLPLSAVVGRRKVPFGRVNQLHPHSWLYAVQPYVLNNLVSGESLTGDGAYLSYLLPTGKLFAQLDAGFFSQSQSAEDFSFARDTGQLITTPGAGFADKFGTVRLLLAADVLGGSVELGGSLAGGRGAMYSLTDTGVEVLQTARPNILLSGLDLTYRKSGKGAARLLLRGEYVNHRQRDHDFRRSTSGYYLFADQRLDGFNSVGLRYDESGFPYADGRERGISLIGTHQITEATLYRLQYTHGSRPGKRSLDELHFELIFGVGPHTHNLE